MLACSLLQGTQTVVPRSNSDMPTIAPSLILTGEAISRTRASTRFSVIRRRASLRGFTVLETSLMKKNAIPQPEGKIEMIKDGIGGVCNDISTISLHFKQVFIVHGDEASVPGIHERIREAVYQVLILLPAIATQEHFLPKSDNHKCFLDMGANPY